MAHDPQQRTVAIRDASIRLGQLLKLADVVDGGGEVKDFLAAVDVRVNGEPEDRRGRQLHPGDVVAAGDVQLRIVAG
jgi:ribosome-associated protein